LNEPNHSREVSPPKRGADPLRGELPIAREKKKRRDVSSQMKKEKGEIYARGYVKRAVAVWGGKKLAPTLRS